MDPYSMTLKGSISRVDDMLFIYILASHEFVIVSTHQTSPASYVGVFSYKMLFFFKSFEVPLLFFIDDY